MEVPGLFNRSVEENVPLVEYSARILSARKVVNFESADLSAQAVAPPLLPL